MIFRSTTDCRRRRELVFAGVWWFIVLAVGGLPGVARALPDRLVLAVDGVAYRDLKALQAGVTVTNFWGHPFQRRAFTAAEGYFPVSRMISTFPSASDVAWTDIFGDRPLPGYQRTYYSAAANTIVSIDGVTTTMEHERQMDWQVQNGFLRALGYLFPAHTFAYELHGMAAGFWQAEAGRTNYYVYLRASDDAQHLDRDILGLLCKLDQRLQQLRARYRTRTGHDLEIVMLSDHGHNHAGRGRRVREAAFLEQAGYHVTQAINGPKDVVLPVVGIESWVEVHCAPAEAERLARVLCQLEGAELLTAPVPGQTNQFLVLNAKGERADIQWRPADNAFRYAPVSGDPLNYQPVLAALDCQHQLDGRGFAGADAWLAATITNRYPLAPERIVRGLTRGALNPATILISLDNRYVNGDWLTEKGSHLVSCRSTHGGLDDRCSDGILLSNFAATRDTSTARVAGQFGGFAGVRDFRAREGGGEWVTRSEQAWVRLVHVPFEREFTQLPDDGLYLRIWSPALIPLAATEPVTVTIRKVPHYATSPAPCEFVLDRPMTAADSAAVERLYALPPELKLAPRAQYEISGRLRPAASADRLFDFNFYTDADGRPAPY